MKLSEILEQCKTNFNFENFFDFNVIDVSANSRIIKNNFIYAAIKGTNDNGENYLSDVIKFRKIAVLISKSTKINLSNKHVVFIRTVNVRKLFSEIASIIYKNSINEKVAITGTNGKTSISDYVRQIWETLRFHGASIGTLGIIYKKKKIDISKLTTPDAVTLHKQLNHISKKNCNKIIIEASSIGLEQNRLYPIKFDKVAFSNLSRDHLDYHKNFLNYKKAKSILFIQHIKSNSIAVLNTDDKYSNFFFEICRKKKLKVLDFGKNGKFLKFFSLKKKDNGFEYDVHFKNEKRKIFTKAISEYEIYNKICSLIIVFGNDLDINKFKLLNNLKNPPGRLDKVKKNWNIFIDYAHTPDALSNVLKNLKRNCEGNLFTIIGCGGDRDKTKRPLMTKEALKFSDQVIITDDNPRMENPAQIRKDMMKNLSYIEKKKVMEIADRKKAIMFAINLLKKMDYLLIAGKGHENYQLIGNKKYFFSDKLMVKKIINCKDYVGLKRN